MADFSESRDQLKDFNIVINNEIIISAITFDDKFSLIITNGLDKLYSIELSREMMQDHRENSGIEGTWTAYFQLLRQALDQKSLTITES